MSTSQQQKLPTTKQQKLLPPSKFILFDKGNYVLMAVGIIVLALGFILMAGGKSPDPNQFHDDEIYSTTRITIAPILIIAGFLIEVVAIIRKPKA